MCHSDSVLQIGEGWTYDMSGGGILFAPEKRVAAGCDVKRFIDWPAKLHDTTLITLVASELVVPTCGCSCAIRIVRHEGLTQGAGRAAGALAAAAE